METQRTVAARFREGRITQEEAQLEIELFWAGALKRAVLEGDVENGSLMAGQSVGMVSRVQPTKEILDELIGQALAVLADREILDAV
jgi:enoyl-[acyl-carrier protein] reductase II